MRPDRESTACGCVVAVRHGADGQAPLAVARARVPYSLDGLRCWCQVACAPGCDQALSDAEAEVSPSQRTAELVDEARQPVPTTPLLADVPLALHWRHGHRSESWGTLGRRGPTAALDSGSLLPHLHQDWAHPCPHLHQDWAQRCHICARTWLAPPSSAPSHARAHTHTLKPLSGGLERLPRGAGAVGYRAGWHPLDGEPGLSLQLPWVRKFRTRPSHICTGTGLAPLAASAPGLGLAPDNWHRRRHAGRGAASSLRWGGLRTSAPQGVCLRACADAMLCRTYAIVCLLAG